jgi:3-deoxy-D-manno-octulosonic-acid transferase
MAAGYALCWVGALAVASPYLAGRAIRRRGEMKERCGAWDPLPAATEAALWMHAASLGETRAALPLLAALSARGHTPLVSVVTPTARALESEVRSAGASAVRFAPLDFPPFVRRVMRRLQPTALLIVETEIWPGVLREALLRRIPTAFVSARLSQGGWRRSRWMRPLLRGLLRGVHVAAQRQADAERWIDLGVCDKHVRVTGNTKYEAPRGPLDVEERRAQRRGWQRIVVLGSVRSAEIGSVVAAVASCADLQGPTLWVVVPRHPGHSAAALLRALGAHLPVLQRMRSAVDLLPLPQAFLDGGANRAGEGESQVHGKTARATAETLQAALLVTTMGELRRFYALADLGFVGGTLCPVGGHNLFEVAELGVPVLFGPHTENVDDTAEALLAAGGGKRATGGEALGRMIAGTLDCEDELVRGGTAALETARRLGGAVGRTLAALEAWDFPIRCV